MPTDAYASARGWFWLALAALIGSGLFSVLLVLSRTPEGLEQALPGVFFRVALVVHVSRCWCSFVALAGLIWSLRHAARRHRAGQLGLCSAGAALMSLAPFLGNGEPIMANIPVLDGALPRRPRRIRRGRDAAGAARPADSTCKIGSPSTGAGALHFG